MLMDACLRRSCPTCQLVGGLDPLKESASSKRTSLGSTAFVDRVEAVRVRGPMVEHGMPRMIRMIPTRALSTPIAIADVIRTCKVLPGSLDRNPYLVSGLEQVIDQARKGRAVSIRKSAQVKDVPFALHLIDSDQLAEAAYWARA